MKRRLKGSLSKTPVKWWSWLDRSADVSIPTGLNIEVLILSPFVFFIYLIIALVKSFRVCKKLENETLKEFKICRELKLMASFVSRNYLVQIIVHKSPPKAQRLGLIPPSHLPIFLEKRWRLTVCCQAERENRTFVTCSLCDVALCIQKERNLFYNVTHILKTFLEHDFHDVKTLII